MNDEIIEEASQLIVDCIGVENFINLDNSLMRYLFAYLQSGACACPEDAINQVFF
jgi:hypothetical protein